MTSRYFTIAEAADYVGVSQDFLRKQCKMRLGPAFVKPSERKYLFFKSDLDRWVDGGRRFSRSDSER